MDAVLHGSLGAFRLAEVLTLLSTSRKSGTLTLESDDRRATIFFSDGAVVFAGTNQEPFRLGSILLRRRTITREQRDAIDQRMRREGGQFGALAVQDGILTQDELRDYLKVQVSEIVFDAFVWSGGVFAFSPALELPAHAVKIAIDLPNLIMEGARRIEEWTHCLELLPDSGAVFRVVARPKDDKITLTADEWKILFLINGVRTLEELCGDAEDDRLAVYRVVYGLLANNLIEVIPRERENKPVEDTHGPTMPMPAMDDATVRQVIPRFQDEATLRDSDANDDTSLLVSSEARLSYADVVRPTVAQLKLEDGTTFALIEPEYLLGRHRDNQIVIGDLGVSSFHARIFRGADGYVIEDLKSRNGTWINGSRVFHATLQHGDKLHLGATDVMYELVL
ncbi:MAG TPA: DUF4388 domain-containing protein [Thermoanaerobaculia bacterium]|nr:DUF4388 domain-containing protein [Thermoanaerobaculia bacterium]